MRDSLSNFNLYVNILIRGLISYRSFIQTSALSIAASHDAHGCE